MAQLITPGRHRIKLTDNTFSDLDHIQKLKWYQELEKTKQNHVEYAEKMPNKLDYWADRMAVWIGLLEYASSVDIGSVSDMLIFCKYQYERAKTKYKVLDEPI